MKTQLTELLTNYGDIAGIWFVGKLDKNDANWYFDEIYKVIHDIQPQCLIGNNHHESIIEGEDFQMFEKDLTGKSTKGFASKAEDIGTLPKEVCETINGSWGFNLQDDNHKSKKTLVQYLVKAAGYGSNLLLNVGPMPNGKIQSNHIESLAKVGNWLKTNGETIYGTKEGKIPPTDNYVSTQKGKKLYLHLLEDNKKIYFIPEYKGGIKSMTLYKNKTKVEFEQNKYGLLVKIPENELDTIDTIIEITLK